ncbi:MAG: right-handed parallel beta-helix repeat-containing protein [Thermoplasmatales archaeon]|nr:right-handed parallel beta-helix repeat-containing protein [Thermoplasmatales archaeon]
MKHIIPILVILLLLSSGFVGVSYSIADIEQSSMSTFYEGSLSGYVNNTSMNPIEGALVRVYFHGTYEENYTDTSGYYHVTNIPICNCTKNCTASKLGYKTEWVLLSIDENTTHDFILTPLGNILYVGCLGPHCYNTIQDAIDNASDGDTVFVYDDSSPYYENVVVNKSIYLIGENKNTTIIDGNSNGDVVNVSAGLVTIRGFTIQNSGDYSNNYLDIYDAGLEIKSDNNIICGNIIANNNLFGVLLDGSSYNEYISENIITNNYASGIILANSSNNNRIFRNSITNNKYGCRIVLSSNNNNISKNIIKDNHVDGVVLVDVAENSIYNNIISNNGNCGLEIEFYNYNNTISGNIITDNNDEGIDLHYLCNNNLILQNTIKNNRVGIDITNSYDNLIYYNNFIKNGENAHDKGSNIWDDAEYGNYWSDYKERYPKAKRIWLKGIWDTSYEIPEGDNKDMCPLIKQWPDSLSKTMPKNQQSQNWWFLQFLQNHPRMFPIMRQLLGL